MATQIDVCAPFSHCEKRKPSAQVFFVARDFSLFAPGRLCTWDLYMLVCVPGYCCGGTVARTNHYLVVVGLERSAVWNVRLCSTGARCSRALLKCPIKEGRVRLEWVCVWEWLNMREEKERGLCVMLLFFSSTVCTSNLKRIYIEWHVWIILDSISWTPLETDFRGRRGQKHHQICLLAHAERTEPLETISLFPPCDSCCPRYEDETKPGEWRMKEGGK